VAAFGEEAVGQVVADRGPAHDHPAGLGHQERVGHEVGGQVLALLPPGQELDIVGEGHALVVAEAEQEAVGRHGPMGAAELVLVLRDQPPQGQGLAGHGATLGEPPPAVRSISDRSALDGA
jgi:hypothetical protein